MNKTFILFLLPLYCETPNLPPQPAEDIMNAAKKLLGVFTLFLATSSFAGAAQAVDSDFRITGGDVLQISVWKEEGMDREVLVMPDGTISFPLAGTLSVQDKSLSDVQNMVKAALKNKIPSASVTVMVKAPTGHTVSVLGQVAKPGEIVMSRRMSAMQALSIAGGLTPFAKQSGILVLRTENGKKTSIEFPYGSIIEGENLDQDIDLKPGDVIMVPAAGLL